MADPTDIGHLESVTNADVVAAVLATHEAVAAYVARTSAEIKRLRVAIHDHRYAMRPVQMNPDGHQANLELWRLIEELPDEEMP